MTRLQIALDGDLTAARAILENIQDVIDVIEIGTPLIYREGMHGVRGIRDSYPNLDVLADLKIMDAGKEEAQIAFDAGADIVTVMGITHDATIQGAVASAREYRGKVMVDMMLVDNLVERGEQLLKMGCDILCLHTAYDVQSSTESPYHDLKVLREHFPSAKLAIAGGVTYDRLDHILPYQPDVVIVGGSITRADNPKQAAKQIYERIHANDN